MSGKNNVNPDHYKVAGRDRQDDSARARTESRGGHFREDYPHRDDDTFMRHTMAYLDPDSIVRLEYMPVVQTRYQPTDRKY